MKIFKLLIYVIFVLLATYMVVHYINEETALQDKIDNHSEIIDTTFNNK